MAATSCGKLTPPFGEKRSFADVLQHPILDGLQNPTRQPKFMALQSTTEGEHHTPLPRSLAKIHATYKGEPAVFFSQNEIESLSQPLQRALIGKFSRGRPNIEAIRKDFQTIGFKGGYQIGLLDNRHILLRFNLDEDYHRCWLRASWNFGRYAVRILKWTPNFTADEEPAIVPVWISFQHLPLHLFGKEPLNYIAQQIGRPLKVDAATQNLTRPSVARICVEINLLCEMPKRIWIGTEATGFWQSIEYENLPNYCHDCKKIGHNQLSCNLRKLSGNNAPIEGNKPTENTTAIETQQMWKPKEMVPPVGTQAQSIKGTSSPDGTAQENIHPTMSGLNVQEKSAIPIVDMEVQKSGDSNLDIPQSHSDSETDDSQMENEVQLPTIVNLQKSSANENDSQPIASISIDLKGAPSSASFGIVPMQHQQVQVETTSTLESDTDNEITHTYRRLTDEELIARMPDRPWQTPTRAVHSTEKKQTSKKDNLSHEPQQMLSFKLPEISRENEMSHTEEAMDDEDISIQVEHFDNDDFIPVISKKQKARNKKDYSLSVKTMHTRQDSKRPAS